MSKRAIMNIAKWIPIESDENKLLFVECKLLKVDAEGLVESLGLFLNDFKCKNILKIYNVSTELPLRIEDLELIVTKLKTLIAEYNRIFDKMNASKKDVLFFRMESTKENLWQIKLKLSYMLQSLVSQIAHLYVSYGDKILELALKLSLMFNDFLELDTKFSKNSSVCSNTCAYLQYPHRKLSITKLLQILAQRRAEMCCHKLIDCLLAIYKSTESHDDDSSSNSDVEIYRALTRHMTPPVDVKETTPKKGNGKQNGSSEYLEGLDDMIEEEENNVVFLLTVAIRVVPTFLGNEGIKITPEGDMKISKRTKTKALDYYEQILWAEVGNYLEHIILWWGASPMAIRPPHSSQHLREWIIQFIPSSEMPGFINSALQSMVDALGCHVTSTSWDQTFRLALVSSKKPCNPTTGRLFSEMLQDLVSLSNQCEVTSDWIAGAPLEELPLVEQIPILHRLDHSIHTTRLWAQTETKRLANNWNVDSFFMITHCEIANCLEQLADLRMADHSIEIAKGGLGVHTNVCANMRAKLVSEVQDNVKSLKQLPDECVECLAAVCKTVSLANLQMVFPDAKYWKATDMDVAETPSSYVATYLDRVLSPVLAATSNPILSNMVLRIMCEAWLDHIYMNKIKFTNQGAYQLLKDFASVGDWLVGCPIVTQDTRKKMLKNEVLRRCEGVGKLLLRSPGEQIKMSDKSKRIEQNEETSPKSDNAQLMPAEMYVPNQEQWLELRATKKKSIFKSSLCCTYNY